MWLQSSQTEHIRCSKNYLILSFIFSVVRFRRTGESTRSEDDVENREQVIKIAEQTDLEAVALAEEAPVPREFANPTDGTGFLFVFTHVTQHTAGGIQHNIKVNFNHFSILGLK